MRTPSSEPSFDPAAFTASQQAHWGEIIQGPVKCKGEVVTALITMPRSDRQSTATFTPRTGSEITVTPGYAVKTVRAVRAYLDSFGLFSSGGHINLKSNIRVGCGSGSSTSDILASIKAAALSIGAIPHPIELQRLCWQIERASDPLALHSVYPVLYGSRCGQLIKTYSQPLPSLVCLGFDTASSKSVSTDDLAASEKYSEFYVEQFSEVLNLTERAMREGDAALLGEAATESARLNQSKLPLDSFEKILDASKAVGALGLSASHSGTVASAIFSPGDSFLDDRLSELKRYLLSIGCADVETFSVGKPELRGTMKHGAPDVASLGSVGL